MTNPVRGFLHGTAGIVALAGLVALVTRSRSPGLTFPAALYGLALVCMYVTSAMYHSIPWRPRWKRRMQALDHIFIYALVAGTFTPLLVVSNQGFWLVLGLVGVWTLAGLGLMREFTQGPVARVTLPLQYAAGVLALVPTLVMLTALEPVASGLIIGGSAAYIFGAWLFVNDRPRLLPGIFSHHEFFHVVVIVASVAHFLAVWRVIDVV